MARQVFGWVGKTWLSCCVRMLGHRNISLHSSFEHSENDRDRRCTQIDVTDEVNAQRQLARAHTDLAAEKARIEVLLARQHDRVASLSLIGEHSRSAATGTKNSAAADLIEGLKAQLASQPSSGDSDDQIELLELLGEGNVSGLVLALRAAQRGQLRDLPAMPCVDSWE